MTSQKLANLRSAFDASANVVHLQTAADVALHFPAPPLGTQAKDLGDKIKAALPTSTPTGWMSVDLRHAAFTFKLERALGLTAAAYDTAIEKIVEHLQNGKQIVAPTDPAFQDIATMGRALAILEKPYILNNHHENVARAVAALTAKGYTLTLADGRIDRNCPGVAAITADVIAKLQRVGLVDGMRRLVAGMQGAVVFDFDQYLYGRSHSYISGLRDPTCPWNLLLNLIARLPDSPPQSDADVAWDEAATLARDVVAALDVETYNAFQNQDPLPQFMAGILSDIGLHDHVFQMQQWIPALTPFFVDQVFTRANDQALTRQYGWNIGQAVVLAHNLTQVCSGHVTQLTAHQLATNGLPIHIVNNLLPYVSHTPGQINLKYRSPMEASQADLMFKPLVALGGGTYLAPPASLVGPAYFEAIGAALRGAIGQQLYNSTVGGGLERALKALLQLRKIMPTRENAKYFYGKGKNTIECDFVLEDAQHIIFIECKSKAVTRATMSGQSVNALIDYASSTVASQAQAMRHERYLRQLGKLIFDDGYVLTLGSRRIIRLSLTLLDHGTFQDRHIFHQFALPVLSNRLNFDPNDPNASFYKAVNANIQKLMTEIAAVNQSGAKPFTGTLGAASLSAGQLAAMLLDCNNVADLAKRLVRPITFSTRNPLLEYRHMRVSGIV